jgi:hypothetical protein
MGPAPARATTPPTGSAAFADSERRWLVPTLVVVLVAVALGVAGLLLQSSGDGIFGEAAPPGTTGAAARGEPIAIVGSIDFDPQGDGEEHPDEAQAGYAYDGDAGTSWSSENYASPDWGGFPKDGVGLIVELEQAGPIGNVQFDTTQSGWAAEVYVADHAQDSIEAWGDPVGTFPATDGAGESGTASVDVDAEGGAVLIWFTHESDDLSVKIDEVRVSR